ncbi:MAG: hypothetical protein F6K26_02495 [Moorea sp. SIO2I5]|nr:hypothetical protein [Moorena sp. SIO2I5]
MGNHLKFNRPTSGQWSKYLILIILLLGIVFRLVNIDKKVYWIDEAYTSLRISGYTKAEIIQEIDGRQINVKDLQQYQRPNDNKDVGDTIQGLALYEPQHSPLYFVMAHFWAKLFGYSVTVMRSLPALISLLTLPCIYWLCLELFESPLTGWIAIALLCVSPFHVLYAQEARQYSLWTVTTLVSSIALLRAMRLSTMMSWVIYAITVSLNLYSYLLSGLVFIGHGIYVICIEKFRFSKQVVRYGLASLFGIIAFLPWLILVIENGIELGDWADKETPLGKLITRWLINLSSVFFDIQIGYNNPLFDVRSGRDLKFNYDHLLIYLDIIILIIVGYSIYFLCRNSQQRVWLFILTMIAVVGMFPIGQDLILGGQRSSMARYFIPCYLGIQLAVAYLLAKKINPLNGKTIKQQQLWRLVAITVISGGVLSCAISSQAETWWHKYSNYYTPEEAHIINEANRPLVISSDIMRLVSLSYLLEPNVTLQLIKTKDSPKVFSSFSDVFLYRPSPKLRQKFEEESPYEVKPAHKRKHLWKLVQ